MTERRHRRYTPHNPPRGYHYFSGHLFETKHEAELWLKHKEKNRKRVIYKDRYGPGYTGYQFVKNPKRRK